MTSFAPIYFMALVDVGLTISLLAGGCAEANPGIRATLHTLGGLGYLVLRIGLLSIVDQLLQAHPGAYSTYYYGFLLWSHLGLMVYWVVWVFASGLIS